MIMAVTREPVEQVLLQSSNATTGAGAIAGLTGYFASSHFLGLLGVIVAVIGVVANVAVNVHFSRKRDQREQAEHDRRLEKMITRPGALT